MKSNLEIVKVWSVLEKDKLRMSNNKWLPPLKCRVGQAFRLLPDHPLYGFCLVINFDIYETNEDTDFILDVPAQAVIRFNPKSKWSSEDELYECYLKAVEELNKDLEKEATERGIGTDITIKPAPFLHLKNNLTKAIQDSFDINYDKEDL